MVEIKGKIIGFRLLENKEDDKQKPLIRNQVVHGYTMKISYNDHSLYFTLNFDEQGNLLELFVNSSSTSSSTNAYIQAIARMVSNQLKYRIPVEKIIKHLDNLDSGETYLVKFPGMKKSKFIKSIPDLIAKVLTYYKDEEILKKISQGNNIDDKIEDKTNNESQVSLKTSTISCPSCGSSSVKVEEGCFTCLSCGYSKCG